MKPFTLKRSISRKRSHNVGLRQQKRIISEMRNNLHKNFSPNCARQSNANSNNQDLPGLSHVECSSFIDNFSNNNSNFTHNINAPDNCLNYYNSSDSDEISLSLSTSSTEFQKSFQERLASCFIDNN